MSNPQPDVDHLGPLLAKACEQKSLRVSRIRALQSEGACYMPQNRGSEDQLDPGDESVKITLVEAEPGTEYIAISHVWSDGLGNPNKNAIPQCQLQRLSHHIRNMGNRYGQYTYFWLDTICIPPDSICQCTCPLKPKDTPCSPPCQGQQMAEAQRISLELMRKTYENAAAVLVLDSWLYETTCEDKSLLENLLKIFASTWTRRLWTLQEGALAKSLQVQFLDTAFDVDLAIVHLQEIADQITKFGFLPPVFAAYWELRHFNQSHRLLRSESWGMNFPVPPWLSEKFRSGEHIDVGEGGSWIRNMIDELGGQRDDIADDLPIRSPAVKLAGRLVSTISAVFHRSTSVSADEPLCLATLLDLDVGRIAAISSGENRMHEFWRMFDMVPRAIPFLREPKINAPGFRWASRSFLRSARPVLEVNGLAGLSEWWQNDVELVEVRPNGHLAIRAEGIILPTESRYLLAPFYLKLPDINRVYVALPESQDASEPNIPFVFGIDPKRTYHCKNLAIILDRGILGQSDDVSAGFGGILVAIEEQSIEKVSENEEIDCRRICAIECQSIDHEMLPARQVRNKDMLSHMSDYKPGGPLNQLEPIGAIVVKSQRTACWCIG
ncbi:unnamed protein product [Clonostachys rosea]|uniref:Heterokaryon incompatibility domain-containing protein n=1 Tax=Bionectria ochroleuca TaxID=29856 RepID=A0ABY6TN79_BIOOC|nr:unnamed protein product [Clonostachys rosea]